MNILEKAEKSLEYLKNSETSAKSHELQAAAGTLGRCLGALGSRPNCARHYANLLQSALPVLLSLASNDSAEVRLAGDEALNRAVVGGFAFHSYKTNLLLQTQLNTCKNARWFRAVISRICLGDCWLRPGVGKIRSQAQTLLPRLSDMVQNTDIETKLVLEAIESNLSRILNALAEYNTDYEICDLINAMLTHIESLDPPIRRAAANCVALLVSHRETLLAEVLGKTFEKLWPLSTDNTNIQGWFGVIKSLFQTNNLNKLIENDVFSVQQYLELYNLSLHYLEQSTEHNTQNAVLETLTMLLSKAKGGFRKALLETHPIPVCLDDVKIKGHKRNISTGSTNPRFKTAPVSEPRTHELTFSGALQLGSLLTLNTPSLSVDDLTDTTPSSPASERDSPLLTAEELGKDLAEKLEMIQDPESDKDDVDLPVCANDSGFKINIGSIADDDVPLKYCARLLASKFLLTGNRGDLISDRLVRVSVKASALYCLSEILKLYPQTITMYLDKDADAKCHNTSGSSEGTTTGQDQINDFILERNVCYQDSLTESLSQDLLQLSMDMESLQQHLHISKKDSKSLEKSQDSEPKSSLKDVQSNILDSRSKDLVASAMTDCTNPNLTNSNITSNSNMTSSNDAGYPMTSSGDVLSSSVDLDMRFDHFGESNTNLENLKDFDVNITRKRLLKRTDYEKKTELIKSDDSLNKTDEEKGFEFQHFSDVFILLGNHNDPQIRGLIRLCVGCYLSSSLDLSHGDLQRWRSCVMLPKDIKDCISAENLVGIVLEGLSDDLHSTVNHTLSALTAVSSALCHSTHWSLLIDALHAVIKVETNKYWLCRVNLCKFYEKLDYRKLFIVDSGYHAKVKQIMATLCRLLADQDQKVRNAAARTIARIIPNIYPPKRHTQTSMVAQIAKEQSEIFIATHDSLSLDLVRNIHFYYDLPEELKVGDRMQNVDGLKILIGDLVGKLMSSSRKYYSQGLLEALQAISRAWLPWRHVSAYSGQGMLRYCLDSLDNCNGTVAARTIMIELCGALYPVEVHTLMKSKTNRDIFERDSSTPRDKWQHFEDDRVANIAETFLLITLRMLNVLVHLVEEVNPNVHLNKGGIALPGSPVRRKTQDTSARKSGNLTETSEEKNPQKKKPVTISLKGNLVGHFYNEPFYMKFYESLRATYSNHKINLDPKNSMFHEFLTTVLKSLSIQLEFATERELGSLTEELLYYLRVLLPLSADTTVYCITQLLKCLFGTNMINQYSDFLSIADKIVEKTSTNFFENVLRVNEFVVNENESRRNSVSSNTSQKLALDIKNPRMVAERELLMKMENFSKNRSDRKWGTNKKELERYIRLFEPVVIQSLKSYTMQNDIPLQCRVLCLLSQLLTLRVNYCMLDSDQVFIGFLVRQLELVEQHEIPNCCELVHNILIFLVQLSSSKHHTKQIIEIPKLIQLCDGLMASGSLDECIAGLQPVTVKVFGNMTGGGVLGRAQQQEAQATREVLFYMLQKTMHQQKVLDLVTCVLSLSQEHPESYYRWSELACDTLLNLLSQRSIELDTASAVASLERLLDAVYRDVLLEQGRVETLLKILFKAPPDQTSSLKLKLRYLSIIMVLLRKILILVPESEILLTINDIKSTHVSPQSIFFNAKPDIDPLNVQNVNENCANLSSDVVLVRFLFKTLTYAIIELDNAHSCGSLDLDDTSDKDESQKLWYAVCVNVIVQVKHMLHLTNECQFPLTSKTAQTILHNEQDGLNTGLYAPDENIPLDLLNLICLRSAHRLPLLTAHWSHLLIRLNFLTHKYWQKLIGFARNLPLSSTKDPHLLRADILQTACVMAYCEYFVENGLSEVVHLTWLLVNRVHILVSHYNDPIVRSLIAKVQKTNSASGLLLQAIAARCQSCLEDKFALNTYMILSHCHESQSGALVFLICRIIGKLEPSIAVRFAKLGIARCKLLKEMPEDQINMQLSKEDLQVALELLQRDKVHIRYSSLVEELNSLASTIFDLSPLDMSQYRDVNPQYIITTNVDDNWMLNQVKTRCCGTNTSIPKVSNHNELALLLSHLSRDDLTTVMTCPEFDRKLLSSCFKDACDNYLKDFLLVLSEHESREMQRDIIREQRVTAMSKLETTSVDSNKMNVVNSLHVFKKNDSRESKSQFFIPMSDSDNLKERFGNLEISDVESEFILPEVPHLHTVAIETYDKCLTDIIRLFPKQNRPLSQSDNFNLNIEQTIDRYTRRCHQVFQDKLFYQEFIAMQTILSGLLNSLDRLIRQIDEIDSELLDNFIENLLPQSLAKNLAIFTVISLQYLSFLIKNKTLVETPVHAQVSFRVTEVVMDNIVVDNVIAVTLENVSNALTFDEIRTQLNCDSNVNRMQSAISCLYAIVKYLVKDTKPLILHQHMQTEELPKPDIILVGDKLVTLIDYWEQNFYSTHSDVLAKCYREPVEKLIVRLSRLDMLSNIALIPPIAWSSVEIKTKKDELYKVDLPLQALQDLDVLEAFLFRVNLIGWSSKKQFEEMWVVLLGALQGNGPHCAVRGITQLLISAAPRVKRKGIAHVSRNTCYLSSGMQSLRTILIDTHAYKLFDDINLERIPLLNDGFDGYHYAQLNTEYLKLASDIIDEASYKVRKEVKRMKKSTDIDIVSCLQLLMDVTAQMLEPKAQTGLACSVALLSCIIHSSELFTQTGQWCYAAQTLIGVCGPSHSQLTQYNAAGRALLYALSRCMSVLDGFEGLQELSTVHQKLIKSLTSGYAPLRQAALQGCLLQLTSKSLLANTQNCQQLVQQLNIAVRQYLAPDTRISLYEQSLYWTVLFTLVELGHPDLINLAVDFILNNPRHYCTELVVKGTTLAIRQQVLPKELKNAVIEKLLDNMKKYNEDHAIQILMVHLFSADTKLLTPRLTSDVSNMDPDVLMNSMERITLLFKVLHQCNSKSNQRIITNTLKYFLRETLPPAATLSRVVIEFLESCKEAEKRRLDVICDRDKLVQCAVFNAEVVFEVFQTAIHQDQLPVLSGWLFEALCHLLHGKTSKKLLPHTLLTLLVSASSNQYFRKISPLTFNILKSGFETFETENWGVLKEFVTKEVKMQFCDRRLLCVVAMHSNFSAAQIDRLKELCDSEGCLQDLSKCLAVL